MQVKFTDLASQNQKLKSSIQPAIFNVIKQSHYILGDNVVKFEQEFTKFLKVKHAVGVASGTDALSLSLLACGVGPGDKVIIPANSYPTVFAVSAINAIPVFVDVEAKTYNLDPNLIQARIDKKTKAIIAVHLYGQPANLKRLLRIAKKHQLSFIEDCAQAHGAKYHNQFVGSFGDLAAFSFYPTKNLGAMGDAGMVVSNHKSLIDKVRLLRMYGEKKRYQSILAGRNSRLDELQAAILRVKFRRLRQWNRKRASVAQYYLAHLNPLRNPKFILPRVAEASQPAWHLFVVRTQKRNQLKDYLAKRGIQSLIHYPTPPYRQAAFQHLDLSAENFPVTETLSREILSLPLYPNLTQKQVSYVCQKVNQFIAKHL